VILTCWRSDPLSPRYVLAIAGVSTLSSQRQHVSTGSPFEPKGGISRAVRSGSIIAVTGTAPLGKDGKTVAKGSKQQTVPQAMPVREGAMLWPPVLRLC
jgi:hypothetical protein